MAQASPRELLGYEALDSEDRKVGTVEAVWLDDEVQSPVLLGVKTGWFGGQLHAVPAQGVRIDDANCQVHLSYPRERVKDGPHIAEEADLGPKEWRQVYDHYGVSSEGAYSPTDWAGREEPGAGDLAPAATALGRDVDTERGEVTLPVSEEQLEVGKRQVQAGRVHLRKVVRTEHVSEPVELRHETVEVQRVPVEGRDAPPDAFQEREVTVPVMREEPVVDKTARVAEEVQVRKGFDTESRTVEGDVRREDVQVERGGVSGDQPELRSEDEDLEVERPLRRP